MCKKIKDILWSALNVLGCKKQSFVYTIPDEPKEIDLLITWSGKALCAGYTKRVVNPRGGVWEQPIQPIRTYYANGDMTTETLHIFRGTKKNHKYSVQDNALYLNCTNVTHLEINGEQII